jgi:hypothetical protein
MINRFPDMDTYFTEINHVLLASRGYEYDVPVFMEGKILVPFPTLNAQTR